MPHRQDLVATPTTGGMRGEGKNLEFDKGTGDCSPTLPEGHRGIFNVHLFRCVAYIDHLVSENAI